MTQETKQMQASLLPLFSEGGVVLLPRTQLPLRLFEPHYIEMLDYALAHGRLIGILQPRHDTENQAQPPLYQIGCIGRVDTFSQTEGGHYLINLTGLKRFSMIQEHAMPEGFRCASIDTRAFEEDRNETEQADFDRTRLVHTLRLYCDMYGVSADWSVIQSLPAEGLISSLAMICPFSPSEKQALLESPTLQARADTLHTLLEMACLRQSETAQAPRH